MPSAPEGNWREQEERAISMGEARMDEERGLMTEDRERDDECSEDVEIDDTCRVCGNRGEWFHNMRDTGYSVQCMVCGNMWRILG